MPQYQIAFQLNLPQPKSLEVCHIAITNLGMQITSQNPGEIACKEPFFHLTSSPAQLKISLNPITESITQINLVASNFGWGAVQSSHVKNQTQKLINEIKKVAPQSLLASPQIPLGFWETYSKLIIAALCLVWLVSTCNSSGYNDNGGSDRDRINPHIPNYDF